MSQAWSSVSLKIRYHTFSLACILLVSIIKNLKHIIQHLRRPCLKCYSIYTFYIIQYSYIMYFNPNLYSFHVVSSNRLTYMLINYYPLDETKTFVNLFLPNKHKLTNLCVPKKFWRSQTGYPHYQHFTRVERF